MVVGLPIWIGCGGLRFGLGVVVEPWVWLWGCRSGLGVVVCVLVLAWWWSRGCGCGVAGGLRRGTRNEEREKKFK